MSKSNEVDLKSCPFCGAKAMSMFDELDHHYSVRCIKSCVTTFGYSKKEEAIEAWNTRHNELVELDEEAIVKRFERFLEPHTCGWKIKQVYIDNGHYFKSWITEICAKFGQRQTEDVGELLEATRELLLEYSARRKAEWGNRYEKDELELSAEQAIAKFKEKK